MQWHIREDHPKERAVEPVPVKIAVRRAEPALKPPPEQTPSAPLVASAVEAEFLVR